VLAVVLPIIFVAIPNKAQHDINASTLEVTSQEVTSPTSKQVHLKLVSIAKSGSSFHPTLDAFEAGMSLDGKTPFAKLMIPQTKANAETTITVDQDIEIFSTELFTEYTKTVISSETFDVYMVGKTKVHQSGLQAISVDYNKKISLKGLNKLQGLNITSLKLIVDKNDYLSDGSNMVGTIFIPNPSTYTLDLGNVTMNLAVDGKALGYALMPNLLLKPGDNNIDMQSTVDPGVVISLITSKYKNAILPLDITGNSSIKNGEHLEYYETAIKSNKIRVDLNAGPVLAAIGLNVSKIN